MCKFGCLKFAVPVYFSVLWVFVYAGVVQILFQPSRAVLVRNPLSVLPQVGRGHHDETPYDTLNREILKRHRWAPLFSGCRVDSI